MSKLSKACNVGGSYIAGGYIFYDAWTFHLENAMYNNYALM